MNNSEIVSVNLLEDRRPKNWFWDYNDIFDSDLSAHAKLCRLYLARCAGNERRAWPSLNTIAKYCSVSKPTAKRAVQELEEKGWLVKTKRLASSGEHLSNVYVLSHPDVIKEGGGFSQTPPVKNITTPEAGGGFSQNPPVKNITTFDGGVGSHRPYVGSEVYHNNTNIKNNNINNTIQQQQQKDLSSLEGTGGHEEKTVDDVGVENKSLENLQEDKKTPGSELMKYALEKGIELSPDFSVLFLDMAGGSITHAKSAIDSAIKYASGPGVEIENPEGLLINSLKFSAGAKFLKKPKNQNKKRTPDNSRDEKYKDLYVT